MKKIILILILVLCLCCIAAWLFYSYWETDVYEQERYFSKINSIIKDLEFDAAKAKDGKIILYNKVFEIISEIPFEEYDEDIKFIYAHKDGPVVYFITKKAVDDEWGIMFVNDGSDSVLNGVKRVTRLDGNSYEYSTMR